MIEMLFDDEELTPPAQVAANAARGLELRMRFKRGGTDVGVRRAQGLERRRPITAADIKAIYSYFARHEVDRRAAGWGHEADPSAGYVAWLLWGGDEGRLWIGALRERLRSLESPRP
ncbi:MAG TPA: hypothetical protein VF699_05130 [Caulobacteraceae bacterium]|jgi:hypothetical protein